MLTPEKQRQGQDDLTPEKLDKISKTSGLQKDEKPTKFQPTEAIQRWDSRAKGVNAEIDVVGRTARRVQSFNKAMVFGTMPAKSCRIRVLQVDDDKSWDGSIQFGFSLTSPEDLSWHSGTLLVEFIDGLAVSSINEAWHDHLDVGSEVEWTLQDDGSIQVCVANRFDKRSWGTPRIMRKSASTVYPCVGIYGNVKAVQLL
mmetsp:Transcript_7996/g.14625  ORF Transcript_7996/g.14625 Transcript_7996/m.14625 type:complete len:200 (+) Transcript_7996:60-659(+)